MRMENIQYQFNSICSKTWLNSLGLSSRIVQLHRLTYHQQIHSSHLHTHSSPLIRIRVRIYTYTTHAYLYAKTVLNLPFRTLCRIEHVTCNTHTNTYTLDYVIDIQRIVSTSVHDKKLYSLSLSLSCEYVMKQLQKM